MTIYLDISILEKNRTNTGIQRVLKEFLQRAILVKNTIDFKILSYNEAKDTMELLNKNEVNSFLNDIKNFQFKKKQVIDIKTIKVENTTIFFDMDSSWYAPIKRDVLYPLLKQNGFLIFNFIHDVVPIVSPEVSHTNTVKHFKTFLNAVYTYSDLALFNSASSRNDFLKVKDKFKINRDIPTRVTGLGSDFLQSDTRLTDKRIKEILQKKYILFVGTIEPRKNQEDMLNAFDVLVKKYPDLNLVFIGKKGWNVDNVIQKINTHKLKDDKLFWLNDIDDSTLTHFYKNAFIVTYLSKYEGYGLPIAESLRYGNITISSKNSSMYEVGRDLVDYVTYNTQNELVDIISLYCSNQNLYNLKKEHIKVNFNLLSWGMVSNSILDVFTNFEKSTLLKKNHLDTMQFVCISIDLHNLQGTIRAVDKYIDFVKEYIIITAPKFLTEFKQISTDKKLTIIDETTILKEHSKDFQKKDHQSKNWLLRASLLNLDILEDEFIMLDDDNRPLKKITRDFFVSKDGSYNAYYFNNLLDWNHKGTEYDIGQQNMKSVLSLKNYELLSYSSHAPQIINKKIFQEVVDEFFDIGLSSPIDEWSTYFNYAVSHYPYAFNKKVFQTMNWPANPYQWDYPYTQTEISFENYYKAIYDTKVFKKDSTYEEKLQIKSKQLEPFKNSRDMFSQNTKILSSNNMVHGICSFKNTDIELYLSSIPFFVVVKKESDIRLKLNYKLINLKSKDLDIEVVVFLNGNYRTLRKIVEINNSIYQESIIEIPIITRGLRNGMYDITFHVIVNNKYIYKKSSPYLMKLIVNENNIDKISKQPVESLNRGLKQKIKSMPYLGWFIRWSYNLLRLNNLKHMSFTNKKQIKLLTQRLNQQQTQINQQQTQINIDKAHVQTLLRHNHQHHENYKNREKTIKSQISKHISSQALLFHQRIDQYIEEAETTLSKPQDLQMIEEKNLSFCLDDYYLSFEDTFRGSREDILKRYEKYLSYVIPDVKTALDIGCGRGEWVQLLQQNSIAAQGIDLNFAMLNVGIANGVKNLQKKEAFEYLKTCPSDSFDLISAFHIIEHIPYEKLFVLLQEVKRVAKPNATILLETPNPQNQIVASYEFYKDPTHLNPLPAPVIKFLVEYIGFEDVQIEYLNPDTSPTKAQDYLIVAKNPKSSQLLTSQEKPKLAYISPLPLAKSGIADYSAELIPVLSQYYDIEVIVGEQSVEDQWIQENCPIRTVSWFQNNYNCFDRVLYHIGNSEFHTYMPDLLHQISGVIVLHDFYLSNLMAQAGELSQKDFYRLHGFKPLLQSDKSKLTWTYPCNKDVLNDALSVIVHSNYSKSLAATWYMPQASNDWSLIPLLRTPFKDEKLPDKEKLDLPQNSFVVCSFGALSTHKKNKKLLDAWIDSSLSKNKNCFLVFVGKNNIPEYGEILTQTIKNSFYPQNIHITGWTDLHTFKSYLGIADIAVQLRTLSRGETSAATLDCMNFGVPLITNANGSLAELPQETTYMLQDEFQTSDLTKALEELYENKQKRESLSSNAKKYITKEHNPKKCALLYKKAIEKAYEEKDNKLKKQIKNISTKTDDISKQVEAIVLSNFPKVKQKQILVDISTIVRNDLKTGIQRVVRSQLKELIKNAPLNYRVEPIYLSIKDKVFCYARDYTTKLLKLEDINLVDEPIEINEGDIFYGLDLCINEVEKAISFGIFDAYKNLGVKINFLVYDLLPVLKPEFFPKGAKDIHQKWLENITTVADKLICISKSVEDELLNWMQQNHKFTKTCFLHLGADIATQTINKEESFSFPKENITFLVVGTIEPRKGHKQLLKAFEMLWQEGLHVNLVIVGKQGWMLREFIQELKSHPQLNRQLYWFEGLNDEALKKAYIFSDALIMTSQAEGYGLPLVEAAKYNLPIITRDLPVFREVAQNYAYYFSDENNPKTVADAIINWKKLYKQKKHPSSDSMPFFTWKQNAQKLMKILEEE